jgi:hypothetical protein
MRSGDSIQGLGLVTLGLVASLALACGNNPLDAGRTGGAADAGTGGASAGTGGSGGASAGTGGAAGAGSGGAAGMGADGGAGNGGTGGSSIPPSSGVTGTKRLDALTTTEKQMFCDWSALHFGGYGNSITCPGGTTTLDAASSQASCVASFPTMCAVPVSQAEQCTEDMSCTNLSPRSCLGLFSCN